MKLLEYSDDDLLEEVKHRGFKIEVIDRCDDERNIQFLKIGGIRFELTN